MSTTTYYLEMTSPSQLKSKPVIGDLEIIQSTIPQFEFNKFLYILVGKAWEWTDKLSWSDDEWETYTQNIGMKTWVAYFKGSPAGYYELLLQENGDVQIEYFGLAAPFIGKGFGGYLLTHTIETAWALKGTKRVWVHTCSLDHPSALQN